MDVIHRMIELSDTCLDGIEHIQGSLNKGSLEYTISLLLDVTQAIFSMNNALQPMNVMFPSDALGFKMTSLWDSIDILISYYEENNCTHALLEVKEDLLPRYNEWKQELERCLHPYFLS
jgi:hypothetical protein